MTKRLSGFLIWIIVLFIACAVGIGIYFFLSQNKDELLTATVVYTSVDVGIDVEGVAVRSEEIIYKPSGAYVSVLVRSGERVAAGQNIAICFSSLSDFEAYEENQVVNSKLEALFTLLEKEDLPNKVTQYNAEIYSALTSIAAQSSSGHILGYFSDQRKELEQYLLLREYALKGEALINSDIAALISRKNYLSTLSEGSKSYIQATAAGYFITTADGYEKLLTPQKLLSITPEEFSAIMNFPAESFPEGTVLGKMMYGYTWYLAALVDKGDMAGIDKNDSFYVKVDGEIIKMDVKYISESKSADKTLVVLSCAFSLSDMTQSRIQHCRIITNTYEGFKVPAESVRVENGITGVYVLEGAKAVFKKIDILYRGDSYYIVAANFENKKELFIGDEVILGEKNLYDGKMLK